MPAIRVCVTNSEHPKTGAITTATPTMTISPLPPPGGVLGEHQPPPIPPHIAAADEATFMAFCLEWRRRQLEGQEVWDDHRLVEAWLRECSPSQSKETVNSYRRHMDKFRQFQRRWNGLRPDQELANERLLAPGNAEAVTDWAGQLRARVEEGELKVATYNVQVAAVSSFYRWASEPTRRGFTGIPFTPVPRGLQLKKAPRQPKALPSHEMAAVVMGARSAPRALHPERDSLVIRLMFRLGSRASETVGLRWADIERTDEHHPGGGRVTIARGKGGRSRTLAVDHRVVELLDRLRELQLGQPSVWVIPSLNDRTKPLTRQGLHKLCVRAGKTAGVKFHPHLARHSHATEAYRATRDPKLVQATLGHADIGTTMGMYVDPSGGDSSCNHVA